MAWPGPSHPWTLFFLLLSTFAVFCIDLKSHLESTPPTLQNGSLGSTTARLSWTLPPTTSLSGLSYELKIYGQKASSGRGSSFSSSPGNWSVFDLSPSSEYRFKVSVYKDLSPLGDSANSEIVQTLPGEEPSAPRILEVHQMIHRHINVSWQPPIFTGGDIIAYSLGIKELSTSTPHPSLYSGTMDYSVKPHESSHSTYSHVILMPSLGEYPISFNISIRAMNADGVLGEPAYQILNPRIPKSDSSIIRLLYFVGSSLYRKSVGIPKDLFTEHSLILSHSTHIISLSCFVQDDSCYILDDSEALTLVSKISSPPSRIKAHGIFSEKGLLGSEIQVDWLYKRIYVLDTRRININICRLPTPSSLRLGECSELIPGGHGVHSIRSFKLDPYNGLLHFLSGPGSYRGFSYRGEPIFHMEAQEGELTSLALGVRDGSLLIAGSHGTTFIDVISKKRNFREGIYFGNGKSVVIMRNSTSFFWCNEYGLNYGELSPWGLSKLAIETSLTPKEIIVFEASAQPVPKPRGPVRNVQAILFGDSKGSTELKWSPPIIPGYKGAWTAWRYRVRITNLRQNNSFHLENVPCCSTNTLRLNQSTLYKVEVRVEDSQSIWSKATVFATLDEYPAECLIATNKQSLIHYNSLLPRDKCEIEAWELDFNIVEISGPIGLTDTGLIVKGYPPKPLSNVSSLKDGIQSISFDPGASMLYISGENKLSRINLLNYAKEDLLEGVMAERIAISLKRLCWSSGNTLNCSKLNGEDPKLIFENDNQRILSFCLQESSPDIYFLTSDYNSHSYRLVHIIDSRVSYLWSFSYSEHRFKSDIKMSCYSNKVIWLSKSSGLFVYDLLGDSLSSLPVNSELASFAIVKPSKQHLEAHVPTLPAIASNPLSVDGKRESFNISWSPGPFLGPTYEYRLSINSKPYITLHSNTFSLSNPTNIPFYNVSLYIRNERTFSPVLNLSFVPPESLPYPPKDPRCFRLQEKLTLRWNPPGVNNGPITTYRVHFEDGQFLEVRGSLSEMKISLRPSETLLGISSVNSKGSSSLVPFSAYTHEVPEVIFIDRSRVARAIDVDTRSTRILREDVDFYEYIDGSTDVWVIGRHVYSRCESDIKLRYVGNDEIRVFGVHWLSRSFIWSEDGFEFKMAYMDDIDYIKEPKRLFRAPENVLRTTLSAEAIYLHTENGGIYEYTSSHFLSRVFIDCNLMQSSVPDHSLLGGCNKTRGIKEIVSNGEGLNFWVSQYLGIIHSSYRDLNISLNPFPVSLVSVYSPLLRKRDILNKYRACWIIGPQSRLPIVVNKTTTEIAIKLSTIEYPDCGFALFSPLTRIQISLPGRENMPSATYALSSKSRVVTLKNLSPYTEYNISFCRFNAYQPSGFNDSLSVTTLEGELRTPTTLFSYSPTPTSIFLAWEHEEQPTQRPFHYRVVFRPEAQSSRSSLLEVMGTNATLSDLEPDTVYVLSLSVLPLEPSELGPSPSSKEIYIRTLEPPNQVEVLWVYPRRLELSWTSPPSSSSITSHQILIYPKLNSSGVQSFPSESPDFTLPSSSYTYDITSNLSPNTEYLIQIRVVYAPPPTASFPSSEFLWPPLGTSVTTSQDAPLAPGAPYRVENGSAVILLWDEMDSNVRLYELYAQKNCGPTCEKNWQLVYRGSSNAWGHLYTLRKSSELRFKTRGENTAGWSPYSLPSKFLRGSDFTLSPLEEEQGGSRSLFLWSGLAFLVLAIGGALLFRRYLGCSGRDSVKKSLLVQRKFLGSMALRSANNPLYNWMDEAAISEEAFCKVIRKVPMNSLTFDHKIGSGAFGNVYKGLLAPQREEVALKTLKPSVNSSTKKEFMREALTMSKFNHPNVLRLLGASLEKGVGLVLVLELMDKDLLANLRLLRTEGGILGENLLRFGLDVARGCMYLAQMRHVHRDIAARNCLVSSPTSDNSRIVKIGDFGLAREIYREDYYRRGGLMPVRWMAPESLEDGVYTHQSDVWSFGILLWEIITLGKQPYPGLSTHQVAEAVVKAGRRPMIPPFVPALLSGLMTRTWAFFPDERPSFQDCVEEIEELLLYREELNSISFNSGIDNLIDPIKLPNPKEATKMSSYLEVISSSDKASHAKESAEKLGDKESQ